MTVCRTSAPLPPHRFTVAGDRQLLTVDLPSLESLSGVDLDISSTEVRLLLPGRGEHVRIPLSADMKCGPATAKFSRKRGQLTVVWEALGANEEDRHSEQADEGEKVAAQPVHAEERPLPQDAAAQPAHAEEKPCMDLLRSEVEHVLRQCTVERLKAIPELRGVSVLLDGFTVTGEASVKNGMCCFKAAIDFTWEALDGFGAMLGAKGTGHVADFTQEQLPNVVIRSSFAGSPPAKAASQWVKQEGASRIAEFLHGEQLSLAVAEAVKLQPAPLMEMPEKSMTQWAEAWIPEKLNSLTVRLFGGIASATFSEPHVSGNASVSLREGKPIAKFHLQLKCEWAVTASNAGVGEARGSLKILDFTSEKEVKDVTLEVETAPGKKSSGQLMTAFRQHGLSAVRDVLEQFVHELKLQTGCPVSAA
mmetsp:Transcript_39626/g.72299  ORF Transcript_39626/g.72299 Transcript_39626/m.72299 type:complete len:420 (+) Transcript_39626:60-1319(+)